MLAPGINAQEEDVLPVSLPAQLHSPPVTSVSRGGAAWYLWTPSVGTWSGGHSHLLQGAMGTQEAHRGANNTHTGWWAYNCFTDPQLANIY